MRMKANGNGQTGHYKKKFLEGYLLLGTITAGAEFAGVHRNTVYLWLEKSQEFASEFE